MTGHISHYTKGLRKSIKWQRIPGLKIGYMRNHATNHYERQNERPHLLRIVFKRLVHLMSTDEQEI